MALIQNFVYKEKSFKRFKICSCINTNKIKYDYIINHLLKYAGVVGLVKFAEYNNIFKVYII